MKIINKKARFNYDVIESFKAGIVLTGAEVKSIKSGRANLSDSFVKIIDGTLYLVNKIFLSINTMVVQTMTHIEVGNYL